MKPDEKLDELLDLWEASLERGNELDAAALCKDSPELLTPLLRKITAIKKINGCFKAHEEPAPERPPPQQNRTIQVDAQLVDLEFHDRGGLGVVYKAKDDELNREVAVKFLHERVARNPEDRQRFLQEAEITGRLDHPGVVPVYANGITNTDQPFYVMRFIRGDTFDDVIKQYHQTKANMRPSERRVALQKLLIQLTSVCKTIGYAHTRGIVHRDIKPKNIMLGKYGETLVVDWGIAIPFQREGQFRVKDEKTLVPQSTETKKSGREGEGTPVFMSPEQAAGHDNLGPATDIYSLGTVLYRTLTGKFAFDGDSAIHIKTAIMKGDFIPPRKIDKSIPTPLEAICIKAMQLRKTDRYPTADAMAVDLENYLAEAPVSAHRYTWLEKLAGRIRQHQTLFTTLFATALLLMGLSVFASGKLLRIQNKTQRLLTSASAAQGESLNLTCLMTARTIEYNLEARLMALEDLAGSSDLVALVMNPNQQNRVKILQMLQSRRKAIQTRLESESWFLLNADGQLLCLARDDQSLDELYANQRHALKSYFHGQEFDLPKEPDNESIKPIDQPSLSPVYFSAPDHRELCCLSVPVLSDQQTTIAVLAMEIKMGQFEPLIEADQQIDDQNHRFATLVEMKGDLKGTLLHHPGIKDLSAESVKTVQICEAMHDALSQIDIASSEPASIVDYVDPLGQSYSGNWLSTALPIKIRNRDNRQLDCGWFLMVQDRPIVGE